MRKFLLIALLFVPVEVSAQVATPGNSLAWDQPAPDLAAANSYVYKYYSGGAATGVDFIGVKCAANAGLFTCVVPFPAFTPGSHAIQLTASNAAGESAKSTVFTFTFIVVPGAPSNIRIQ